MEGDKLLLADMIYETLIGEAVRPLKNVPNVFDEGSVCTKEYQNMLDAYDRIRVRLQSGDEDEDVETIINSMLAIQGILCREMFRLGQESVKHFL